MMKDDSDDIDQELLAIEIEIQVLTKRSDAVRSRRLDQPILGLKTRLAEIQDRLVELEPLVLEEKLLSDEADFLRTSIASQTQAIADLHTTENRISSLLRRRNIFLRLRQAAETDPGTHLEAT